MSTRDERLRRTGMLLLGGALAAVAGWLALSGWADFMVDRQRYLRPLLVGGVLVAVTGALVRGLAPLRGTLAPALTGLAAQLVVVSAYLHHLLTDQWRPTRASLAEAVDHLVTGAVIASEQMSPVPAEYPEFAQLILAIGLALLLAIDLVALGLREPPVAGLVLLAVVAVGASMLLDPVDAGRVVGAGAAWLALVAVVDRLKAPPGQHGTSARGRGLVVGTTMQVVGVAAVAALAVPLLVPSTNPFTGEGAGGEGDGGSSGLRMSNPVLDLAKNLSRGADLDVISLRTDDPDPSYLRMTALDEFNGGLWSPADRAVRDDLEARLPFPQPPGITTGVRAQERTWSIQVAGDFSSSWLPLPYPTRRVEVDGRWMVGQDTLDVFAADPDLRTDGLSYDVEALQVRPTKQELIDAGAPGGDIGPELLELPDETPAVIGRLARQVTEGSENDYERMVRLQRWFREQGGFRYSLERASGNGLSTLTRFLTDNRTGYCEQFAASMAIMARSLGVPARIAVGFLRPETTDGVSVFSLHDLHAWPEVYFEGVGWVPFEPTPGVRTGAAPSYTQGDLRPQAQEEAPDRAPIPAPDLESPQPQSDAPTSTEASFTLPSWLPWVVMTLALATIVVLGPVALRRRRTRTRWQRAADADAFADAVWAELRDLVVDAGMRWQPGRTPRAVEQHLVRDLRPDATTRDALHQVVGFVERTRYARPRPLPEAERRAVVERLETWRRGTLEGRLRWSEKWWPRSVRPGGRADAPAEPSTTGTRPESRSLTHVG